MRNIRYESRIVTAFCFQYWTQKQIVASFFDTYRIGDAHSVRAGSKTSLMSILQSSCFSNCLGLGLARNGAEFIAWSFNISSLLFCCQVLTGPR